MRERLGAPGLLLHTGPFISQIRTRIASVVAGIVVLYADYPVTAVADFVDFHITLAPPRGLRRWWRPQVHFHFDGVTPFKPLPLAQALPFLEWGLNWCIGAHAHQFLIIHAAALEKDGRAVILPGPSGSGKSTLAAFLAHNGWRLLSDELALVSLQDSRLTPLARPISLKNRSIDLIAEMVPSVTMSARAEDTQKGTVALMKVPTESVQRVKETAQPAWVIFPNFIAGARPTLVERSKADTLLALARNAFNYSVHGKLGFDILARVVDDCACYTFSYSDLNNAREVFNDLGHCCRPARQLSA